MATFKKAKNFRKTISDVNKKIATDLLKRGINQQRKPFKFSDISSNIFYEEYVKEFYKIFSESEEISGYEMQLTSTIENPSFCKVNKAPSFTISIYDICFIRVTPNERDGIHISRVEVLDEARGKGLGSILLKLFIKLVLNVESNLKETGVIDKLPAIDLDVLSNSGSISVNINKTIALYERFGFKVARCLNAQHVEMEIDYNTLTKQHNKNYGY